MATRHCLTLAAWAAALCSPSLAQERTSPLALVPKDGCLLLIQADGPARLAKRFSKTRFGRFLAGPELRPVWEEVGKAFSAFVADLERENPVVAASIKDLLVGTKTFDGTVTAALFVEERRGTDLAISGVWILSPAEPNTDFGRMMESFTRKLEENAADQLRDVKVDGRTLRVLTPPDGSLSLSLPLIVDGHAVIFLGTDIQRCASRCLDQDVERLPLKDEDTRAQCLAVHVDLKQAVQFFLKDAEAKAPETFRRKLAEDVLKALGFGNLKAFQLLIAPQKDHVLVDLVAALDGAPKGLFAAFVPEASGQPRVLELVPRHGSSWSAGPLRLGALYHVLGGVLDAAKTKGAQVVVEDLEKGFQDSYRVRLKEDLLDHLGTEMLTCGRLLRSSDETEKPADALAALRGLCVGLTLKDAAAFEASLERLLRSRGLHAGRKTEQYEHARVYRLSLLGLLDVRYAVTDRLLLVAFGDEGARELRAVLDEEKERKSGKPVEDLRASVAARLALAPVGWHSIGVGEIAPILAAGWRGGVRGVREGRTQRGEPEVIPPALDLLSAVLLEDRLPGVLEAYGLSEYVDTSALVGNRLVYRLIW